MADDALARIDRTTIETPVEGQWRVYDLHRMSPSSAREHIGGYVFGFRDVIARQVHEQRLEVAIYILRHTLRNKM